MLSGSEMNLLRFDNALALLLVCLNLLLGWKMFAYGRAQFLGMRAAGYHHPDPRITLGPWQQDLTAAQCEVRDVKLVDPLLHIHTQHIREGRADGWGSPVWATDLPLAKKKSNCRDLHVGKDVDCDVRNRAPTVGGDDN